MSNGNWFKIKRGFTEHPLLKRPNFQAIFMYLLDHVAYTDTPAYFNKMDIILHPGQGIFTNGEVSKHYQIPRSTVFGTLARMETEQMIEQLKGCGGTLITVLNWDKYQGRPNSCPPKNKQSLEHFAKSFHYTKKEEKGKELKKQTCNSKKVNQEYLDYYQQKIHAWVSKVEMEAVMEMAGEYPLEEFKAVVDRAAEKNIRHTNAWRYVQKILSTGGLKDFSRKPPNDPEAGAKGALEILESGVLDEILGKG